MFIIDKPYVSEFLKNTLLEKSLPIIETETSSELITNDKQVRISELEAINEFKTNSQPLLLTNSENAISWIDDNLGFTDLPEKVSLFKDKVKFRQLLSSINPEYFYQAVEFDELDNLEIKNFPSPFFIKPAVGFFSLGVYMVEAHNDWPGVLVKLKEEVANVKDIYPDVVLDTTKFIIEEEILGTEYAIDCYFDKDGQPVVLNILKHLFASTKDVSDRVYLTSKEIIEENLTRIEEYLHKVGNLSNLKNFPLHIEVRIDDDRNLNAIEFNPMRFGGWCTTADFTWYSYGINAYQYFFEQKKPDWDELLKWLEEKLFSIVVLDNNSGIPESDIKSFDYDALLGEFSQPLELRKIDFKSYLVFGFLFLETSKSDISELYNILKSDLKKYITTY